MGAAYQGFGRYPGAVEVAHVVGGDTDHGAVRHHWIRIEATYELTMFDKLRPQLFIGIIALLLLGGYAIWANQKEVAIAVAAGLVGAVGKLTE